MGIGRKVSVKIKRRSSVPVFGCRRPLNLSSSDLKTDFYKGNSPSNLNASNSALTTCSSGIDSTSDNAKSVRFSESTSDSSGTSSTTSNCRSASTSNLNSCVVGSPSTSNNLIKSTSTSKGLSTSPKNSSDSSSTTSNFDDIYATPSRSRGRYRSLVNVNDVSTSTSTSGNFGTLTSKSSSYYTVPATLIKSNLPEMSTNSNQPLNSPLTSTSSNISQNLPAMSISSNLLSTSDSSSTSSNLPSTSGSSSTSSGFSSDSHIYAVPSTSINCKKSTNSSASTTTANFSLDSTSSSSVSLSTQCTDRDSRQQLEKSPNFEQNAEGTTRLQKHMDEAFRWLGRWISDYPWWILIAFLLLTIVCSLKIPFTRQEDDLKSGYTPIGARSHQELALLADFYNSASGGEPLSIVVFVSAQDNGTMSRLEHLNETVEFMDQIGNNFRLSNLSFYQFCLDFCAVNEPVRQFRNALALSSPLNLTSNLRQFDLHDRFQLDFPFMQMLGRRIDLSPNFFGVQKFVSIQSQLEAKSPTNIEFLRLIVLQFRAEKPTQATKIEVEDWEREVAKFVNSGYQSSRLKTMALTVTLARDEVVRTGMTLFPFLSVGFVIMAVFSVLSVRLSAYYYQQWTTQKIWLALWACVCPLLATSTALGFLFLFGFRFGSILFVTPFLVMAIGVDDAYLMLHSWQRLSAQKMETKTFEKADPLKWKVSEMLADIGPSITITSATNILAFTVGIFSPTPEIQLFCAGNAVAIFADYLYQLFVFVPVLVLLAKREETIKMLDVQGNSKAKIEKRKNMQKQTGAFMSEYCRWLCNRFTLFCVVLLLCVYWTVSMKGMCAARPKITPKKLFLADSIINDINHLRDDYILPGYTAISVFVRNATNLSDPSKLSQVHLLIEDFEKEPQCLGANFTHFWLRDYERYQEDAIIEEEGEDQQEGAHLALPATSTRFNRQQMSGFLSWPEYKHWNGFLRFNETNGNLEKFFAIVAFHGPEMVAWESRGRLLNRWRTVADRYPDLGAFIWVDEAQFLDQIETLIPSTVQSSIATLICMALVCLLFMCNLFTLAVATLSIVSICIGVFGFLSLWGIDLDPISMATTIMSIGFSVDFPAHLTYHYYRLGKENGEKLKPEERIYHALVAIGYPLMQCGLSTCLFVTCLLFIDTYMSEVFVKTMVLVVSLGLVHALILIPTMLCAFSQLKETMDHLLNKLISKIKEGRNGVQPIRITVVGNRNSVLSRF